MTVLAKTAAAVSNLTGRVKERPQMVPPHSIGFLTGTDDRSLMESAQFSSTLWRALRIRGEAVASIEFNLYKKNSYRSTEKLVDPMTHPAGVILKKPNPLQKRMHFVETWMQHLDLTGKVYIYNCYQGQTLLELYLLRPDRVTPVPTDDGTGLYGYIYTSPSGMRVPYTPDQIDHINVSDPLDVLGGDSAVASLRTELDTTMLASEWQRWFFRNNATPNGVYTSPEYLSDQEMEEMQTYIRENHQGVYRAGRDLILDKSFDYKTVQFSIKDMQFPQLREQHRDMILEGLGVSKTILGQTTDVNRASMEGSEQIFSKYSLNPALKRFCDWLNDDYLPRFGTKGYYYSYPDPVSKDIEKDATAVAIVEKLAALGADPAAVMAAYNLPELKFDILRPDTVAELDHDDDPRDPNTK